MAVFFCWRIIRSQLQKYIATNIKTGARIAAHLRTKCDRYVFDIICVDIMATEHRWWLLHKKYALLLRSLRISNENQLNCSANHRISSHFLVTHNAEATWQALHSVVDTTMIFTAVLPPTIQLVCERKFNEHHIFKVTYITGLFCVQQQLAELSAVCSHVIYEWKSMKNMSIPSVTHLTVMRSCASTLAHAAANAFLHKCVSAALCCVPQNDVN